MMTMPESPDLKTKLKSSDPQNTFLTGQDLEARWGKKPGHAAYLRAIGRGPKFIAPSKRSRLYLLADVLAHEEGHRFKSDSQMIAAEAEEEAEAAREAVRKAKAARKAG
jgi:hypothetical protein